MIAKNYRLQRGQISYILERGLQARSRFFIFRYVKNGGKFSRYCAIISKKIDTGAVGRNKIRRRVYEALRLLKKEGQTKNTYDMALIVKKSIIEAKLEQIKSDLWTNLTKL